jgi:hypothetical protein
MPWKSLISAVLSCALTSGIFAAPSLDVVMRGSHSSNRLDANGNWVWGVRILPSSPIPGGSTALNAEIGFAEVAPNNRLLSATKLSTGPGDDFYIDNPGEVIFGWETTEDIDPGPGVDLKAIGLQVNTDSDQVFSALGSQVYGSPNVLENYIQIKVQGPCVDPYNTPGSSCASGDRLTTTIQWLGAYDGKGRVNERNPNPPPPTVNYDIYSGSVSYTAIPGDMNLDRSVDGFDYKFIFNDGPGWGEGDFNGDGSIDGMDYNIWLFSPGAGSGAGADSGSGAVPEPASVALVASVMFAFTLAALRRR